MEKLLRSVSYPPMSWYRFMDDTWVIQQEAYKELFLDHMNSIDPCIKFHSSIVIRRMGLSLFLIPWSNQRQSISFSIKVYHKPTHTDQYLQWDSHHNLSVKYSVIGTLTHRAKTVCTTLGLLEWGVVHHLKEALVRCKYPRLAINKVQNKVINGNWEDNGTNHVGNKSQDTSISSGNLQPNMDHLQEKTQYGTHQLSHMLRACGKASNAPAPSIGIQTYIRGNRTIKQMLVRPKDQDPKEKKSGVIYSYQCGAIDCKEGKHQWDI